VGRLEDRVRRLEENVSRGGFAAALARASDKDIFILADHAQRVHDAQQAGKPAPTLTPQVAEAVQRFEALREQARREGWGASSWRAC
jgi:hypothetical protein